MYYMYNTMCVYMMIIMILVVIMMMIMIMIVQIMMIIIIMIIGWTDSLTEDCACFGKRVLRTEIYMGIRLSFHKL